MSDKELSLICEGKTKDVYQIKDDSKHVILEFKDKIKHGEDILEVHGRGKLVCETTSFIMKYLQQKGIETHFTEESMGSRSKCQRAKVFPFSVVCRNGILRTVQKTEDFRMFQEPIFLFYQDIGNNEKVLVSHDMIVELTGLSMNQVTLIHSIASSSNYYIRELLKQIDVQLIELELKFGITEQDNIILVDEISEESVVISSNGKRILNPEDIISLNDEYVDLLARLVDSDANKVATRIETVYVEVMPKPGVKNPSGQALMKSLKRMGFEFSDEIKIGKVIKLQIRTPLTSEILKQIVSSCIGLLSNPLSEIHHLRV